MKIKFSQIVSRLCGIGLSLLGFSMAACDEDGGGEIPCMYGSPFGEFEVKGMVTTDDGAGLPDAVIDLKVLEGSGESYVYCRDTTDMAGTYKFSVSTVPYREVRIVCKPAGDEFEADSVDINLKYEGGDGGWYAGTAREEVNFRLKRKTGE